MVKIGDILRQLAIINTTMWYSCMIVYMKSCDKFQFFISLLLQHGYGLHHSCHHDTTAWVTSHLLKHENVVIYSYFVEDFLFELLMNVYLSIFAVRESAMILLQTVPSHIKVADLQERLLKEVKTFTSLHVPVYECDLTVVYMCFRQ